MMDLSVEIGSLWLQNPVMPASGCFGYGQEYVDVVDLSRLGAIVIKGTTLSKKDGNKQPRMMEVAGGLINFIGLQNPGVEVVVRDKIPLVLQYCVPIVANISGNTAEEYAALAERFGAARGIAALEVNISCPNLKEGGVAFGQDPTMAASITRLVKGKTSLPVIVKLTPNVTDVVSIARAVAEAGADAISLINTFKSAAEFSPGVWIEGGLSGPCIMHIALRMVSDLHKAKLGLPIIGIGGISCLKDALLFFRRGADAIQIGTAIFGNPPVLTQVIDGLGPYIESTGCQSFSEWKAAGCPYPKKG
jgi:dihydroorotate dehydrogenase (NAD+) catalytic subunit